MTNVFVISVAPSVMPIVLAPSEDFSEFEVVWKSQKVVVYRYLLGTEQQIVK